MQHNIGYEWLQMRSSLVPVVSVASSFSMWIIFGGLVMGQSIGFGNTLALVGVALFGMGTLFSFITLPVEYDARNLAISRIKRKNIVIQQELAGAEDALKWAARTYVVAAIGSLATLLYFLLQVLGNNRD